MVIVLSLRRNLVLLLFPGVPVRSSVLSFVWVDDFPLFLPREDGGETERIYSVATGQGSGAMHSNPQSGLRSELNVEGEITQIICCKDNSRKIEKKRNSF